MTHRTRASAVTVVLGAVAFLLFARLAVRHVGESYFLADQVDQLQKYEAALRLDPEGLWGPAMSGTAARALGPLGAVVFGLPVSLGLGIDAIHAVTSVLLVIAAVFAFYQLARLDVRLAWVWLIVFIFMRMVWWNAAMFWVNTLLLPIGLVVLGLCAAALRRPSRTTLAAIALVLMLALQIHLVALVGIPCLLVTWIAYRRQRPQVTADRPTAPHGSILVVLSLIGLALLPYLLAEIRTGFRNTRAMLTHAGTAAAGDGGEGTQAAFDTLLLAADPANLFPDGGISALAPGLAIVAVAVAHLWWRSRRAVPPGSTRSLRVEIAMWWLVVTAVVSVAGQALFFRLMARPLNGLHYAILLAPWYAVPVAALVSSVVPRTRSATLAAEATLGLAVVVTLLLRGPVLADRFAERTAWNYASIVRGVDALCAGQAVTTVEGPGLVNELTPGADSVLRYLMKRGLTRCRFDPASDVIIAAHRDGAFEGSMTVDGQRFDREQVVPPGLARYRRER